MFKTSIINSICNLPTQVECTTTYLRQKYIREKMNEEQFNLNGWKQFNLKLLLTIILVGISVGKLLENSPSNRTNFFFKYWISIFSFFAKNTFFVRKLFFQTLFLEIHSHEFTITHVALERTGHNDNVNDDDDDDISRWLSTRECRHQTSSSSSSCSTTTLTKATLAWVMSKKKSSTKTRKMMISICISTLESIPLNEKANWKLSILTNDVWGESPISSLSHMNEISAFGGDGSKFAGRRRRGW